MPDATITLPGAIVREETVAVAWPLWLASLGLVCAAAGLYWDVSWHLSIGRDTFWTPAHVLIQLCGVFAGVGCGALIVTATLRKRDDAVRVLGLRGPLGAFVACWGGAAMATSAPFDDWWHNAYGLDVKVLSPPHVLLASGVVVVGAGVLLLIAAETNRATGASRERLEQHLLGLGTLLLSMMAVFSIEHTGTTPFAGARFMHTPQFYSVLCVAFPWLLVALAASSNGRSGRRFAATSVAALWMALWTGALWLVPLVRAEPKLGPVYTPITHLVPLGFPLLLVAPALAVDLLGARLFARGFAVRAVALGAGFLAAALLAQWPLGSLLTTRAASGWVFGASNYSYLTRPADYHRFHELVAPAPGFWRGMLLALAFSIVGSAAGLGLGDLLRRVRR